MKTAKATPVVFQVTCPACNAGVSGPKSHSFNWDHADVARALETGGVFCFACCEVSKVPAALRRLAE